jgi:hypothetical protein
MKLGTCTLKIASLKVISEKVLMGAVKVVERLESTVCKI